jgi:hypothetical protein
VLPRENFLEVDFDRSADNESQERDRKARKGKRKLTKTAGQSQSGRQPDRCRRGKSGDTVRGGLVENYPGAEKPNPGQHALHHATHGIRLCTGLDHDEGDDCGADTNETESAKAGGFSVQIAIKPNDATAGERDEKPSEYLPNRNSDHRLSYPIGIIRYG